MAVSEKGEIMTRATTFRITTAWALCLCLMVMSINFAPRALITASAQPNVSLDDADVAEGARQFDEAVREVEKILSLDLTTEKGARESSRILEKNYKKLALAEKKAIQAGRKVTALTEGVKAEAAKRKGGKEELAEELKANPDKVWEIPGAQEAARAIRESIRPAGEVLKKVTATLEQAANKAKQKNAPGEAHHARLLKGAEAGIVIGEPHAINATSMGSCDWVCTALLIVLAIYGLKLIFDSCVDGINNAFKNWRSCKITHWWDTLYCNANFARQVSLACPFV
jgi:hypothetical protein